MMIDDDDDDDDDDDAVVGIKQSVTVALDSPQQWLTYLKY